MKIKLAYFVCVLTVLSTPEVYADDSKRAWSIQLENDVFSQFFGLRKSDSEASDFDGDKDYTQGVRLGLTIRDRTDLPFHSLLKDLHMIGEADDDSNRKVHVTYQAFLGQNIYTPTDITKSHLLVNDRPYAGYLYFGSNITRQKGRHLESLELDVGVIGPLSGAKQVQTTWHTLIDTREPEGWDNQLSNEPALTVIYTRAVNMPLLAKKSGEIGVGMDITPHGTLALGTVYTHVSVGGTLRIGTGLEREMMSPNRIQPSQPGSDIFSGKGMDFYTFIGIEGRAVARNAFLDGNVFSESHRIDKKRFVGEFSIGFVGFTESWRLSYTHVFRSREFVNQRKGDFFGSVSLTKLF
ncbi:lipid A deacylase LpxR family protein [Temperatibacter marinus]|uniref:Lipid A deacylase LpxR family protein n=1 Tax=Temperatibacter marinus TaxID=1456591 RepID=A0AA52H9F6_9PROT|nr:lipid A deacylase LpxR family protein [Temperatibacter marinus]WND02452.1 lipid A deacylase LpxR family protein [Temperatibacter marinus]